MKTEPRGVGDGRPPRPSSAGRMDRLSRASARVPFRVKLAVVWLGIFLVLGVLLSLIDFDWEWIGLKWGYIVRGTPYTLVLAIGAILLAITLALLGALGRISRNPVAFGVSGFYASFFRGTPLILQLFMIHFALPQIGGAISPGAARALTFTPVQSGILGLGLNYGAYMTEIFRAGIQSVGHGQSEAAEALGMTYRQKMRRIILPQAVRMIIPPTGNEFIAMMKDTALVSFLGVTAQQAEIFRRATLLGRADFRPLEGLLVAAAAYWILTTIFSYFQGRLERRMSKGYVRAMGAPARPKMFAAGGGGAAGVEAVVLVPPEQTDSVGPDPDERPSGEEPP
ncbi:MAG TPA: amino acid ABC transporter permease [Actinomycetota bacterium]